jgi:hypothetical protein
VTKRTKLLIGLLVLVLIICLYSIYVNKYRKFVTNNSIDEYNYVEYWHNYCISIDLALEALLARCEGRTNDFKKVIAAEGFDEILKQIILHYDRMGLSSKADEMLKVHIYLYVINLADDSRHDNKSYGTEIINRFRKIAALQKTLSAVCIDPEIEKHVKDYIEESIHNYETHAGLQAKPDNGMQ